MTCVVLSDHNHVFVQRKGACLQRTSGIHMKCVLLSDHNRELRVTSRSTAVVLTLRYNYVLVNYCLLIFVPCLLSTSFVTYSPYVWKLNSAFGETVI